MHPDHRTGLPRVSLKRLLVSTTLIAVGLGNLVYWNPHADRPLPFGSFWLFELLWCGGGAAIGAGIFNLFRHPWIGALIGAIVAFFGLFVSFWGTGLGSG